MSAFSATILLFNKLERMHQQRQAMAPQQVCILGSTGSIGTQTLQVIETNKDRFKVFALTAHNNIELFIEQCRKYQPKFAVITNATHHPTLKDSFQRLNLNTELLVGEDALEMVAAHTDVKQVVAGIVGSAGLKSVYAATQAGKTILLANKESLVMTGTILLKLAQQSGATILPIDSEHNALFQCMPTEQGLRQQSLNDAGINKLILTGSGGPFRTTPLLKLANKTPAEACAHPNWRMGQKISVDSATMMNKGLEYIEASLLFNATPTQLDVLIHPQSIIHSFVQYRDGSSIAQLGYSDMRVPIANALGFPERINAGVTDIDLTQYQLTFEAVDYKRYPCLKLAIDVAHESDLPTVLNAANEIAVAAFLNQQIGFTQIYESVTRTLDKVTIMKAANLDDILHLDRLARQTATQLIQSFTK